MRKITQVIIILLLAFLIVPSPIQSQESYTPVFEEAACRFPKPGGYAVECGFLVVPADRTQPEGATVRLHVAIFKTQNPNSEPDPVIYLSGGGGANELSHAGYYLATVGDTILENRDFIMYNQRGSRLTQPELACGFTEFLWERAALDITQVERDAMAVDFWLDCQDRLIAEDVNLQNYSSPINAADANDLRLALGYDQVNFYGTSYGTRLGLDLMRDYPEGIRSMILDSVYPPHIDYYSGYAPNADRAFSLVFDTCAADADCNAQYPQLEEIFYALVDKLNETPKEIRFERGTVIVDGYFFMEVIYNHLYSPQSIPYIPLVITEADNGNFVPIDNYIQGTIDASFINLAVWYSMVCQEETPFDSYEHAQVSGAELPQQIQDVYVESFADFHFTLCESWQVEATDVIESEAVVSDVPTLVLAGQFDPITPPEWGKSTAETLCNSFFYEFPSLAHGVMRSNSCGLSIGLAFIDEPTQEPDASCIDELTAPQFQ